VGTKVRNAVHQGLRASANHARNGGSQTFPMVFGRSSHP
jgi:hypothetical protein